VSSGTKNEEISFYAEGGREDELAEALTTGGTLEGWLEAVRTVVHLPRVMFGLYAALVPPLLRILGCANFIVDFCGATSKGKTTVLRLAASVWGLPTEAPPSLIGGWTATRVAIERVCSVSCDLPVFLDDTSTALRPTEVSSALYSIANGMGKQRGALRGSQKLARWRTVCLSSGEAPATSFTQDGGTRARCLELWGSPFGPVTSETARLVNELSLVISEHHGHLGPLVVQWLLDHPESYDGLRHLWRTFQRDLLQARPGVEGRLAGYFAAVLVAEELASHICPGLRPQGKRPPEEDLVVLWEQIAAEGAGADTARSALLHLESWCASNQHRFFGRHLVDKDGNPKLSIGGWAGKWDPNAEQWEYVAILPDVLHKILKEAGHQPDAILRLWDERGWLVSDKGRHRTKRIRIDGTIARCYCIRRGAFEGCAD